MMAWEKKEMKMWEGWEVWCERMMALLTIVANDPTFPFAELAAAIDSQ